MGRIMNIVWLMTDEQRTDSLGLYGGKWSATPHLDRLAQNSVIFRQAYTPAPICGPARASLLTGNLPRETGIWNHHHEARNYPHMLRPFQDAGYATAAFGKFHFFRNSAVFDTEVELEYAPEVGATQYADAYQEYEAQAVKYPGPTEWILAGTFPAEPSRTQESRMVDQALTWMKTRNTDQPFLLKISFIGPHSPVAPPKPYDDLYAGTPIQFHGEDECLRGDQPQWIQKLKDRYAGAEVLNADQLQRSRAAYYGYCSYLDTQFGRILQALEQAGLMENTIIAFVSDHGTHLGDYGLVQKQTFYDVSARVPFFIYVPALSRSGISVQQPVSTRLLLPLLAEFTGVKYEHALQDDMRSFASAVADGVEPQAKPVISEFKMNPPIVDVQGRLIMIRENDLKLSFCLDSEPEDYFLVDLARDPHECTNVANAPSYRSALASMVETAMEGLN